MVLPVAGRRVIRTDEARALQGRIKQLEDLEGGAKVSEGADAGYMDMANYALFALIHIASGQSTT